jgi:hypothetical protein
MTGFALVAQLSPMIVVSSMTGNTGDLSLLEGLGSVTLLAGDFYMFAEQGKGGQAMIKCRTFPVSFVMAVFATLALFALMYVVTAVAIVAGFTELLLTQHTFVAADAMNLVVLAPQRKSGLLAMIENRPGPGLFVMATFAFLAKFSLMSFTIIVFLVTCIALLGRVLVVPGLVTGRTLHIPMLAQQRKIGLPMVKPNLFPVLGNMTALAVSAEIAFVCVVFPMTAVAVFWRIAMRLSRSMTVLALDFRLGVAARQREVGPFMVKGLAVELHDTRLSSLMIRMTIAAGLVLNPTMKTLLASNIFGNRLVFMAIQT